MFNRWLCVLLTKEIVVSLEGHPQRLYCCLQFSEHPSLKNRYFPDEILRFLGILRKEMG